MQAAAVIKADPVADCARCVLEVVEALAIDALFLQRPDDTLDHAVLLRAVWRDWLMLQAVAADQRGVVATGEDKAII